ncbi:MAG: hypothetical protein ACLQG3_04105 [Terracidiphilus sp.]
MSRFRTLSSFTMTAAALCLAPVLAGQATPRASSVDPARMPRVGTIDERFQSYNVEMVEVTGGRFWKPYDSTAGTRESGGNQPAGLPASLYEYRKPIDLYNSRLRKLAAALGPAYVRVSGTWANSTFFQNSDGPAPEHAPDGFKGVLTRQQWKGVIDFSNAVNAPIVTSLAISPGTRDASGAWTPAQAKQILDFTKANHGTIAAVELMNEPTIPEMGGAPKGYDAAAYGKDLETFRAFVKDAAPKTLVLGPDSVGEESLINSSVVRIMKTEDILAAAPVFDVFAYHTYGAVSSRCSINGLGANTSLAAALSEDWLARGDRSEQFYAALRDRFMPGKPMWNTETAQAACGGDRWASTFADSFRYLNQLGDLARRGVQVQLHNTLASSDYGLLQEGTFEPRPNYWAALLWRKLMGTTVLDAGASPAASLHLYAHCMRNHSGGVVLLAINASLTDAQSLGVPVNAELYTLTAKELTDPVVQLNGVDLKLAGDDSLPQLKGEAAHAGTLIFAPKSITFVAMPRAHNAACGQ